MPQPLIELGGQSDAPILNIALANGFVPETYLPLLRPFMSAYRVVCLPPRALWGDESPPLITRESNWDSLADDLLAGMDAYGIDRMLAIGHSFGAIASMKAAIRQPERFVALVMLDPTILTPEICTMLEAARQNNMAHHHPLAQGAMRRREQFDSVDDAYERFRSKKLFANWSDEAVHLYAEYGTQPDDATGGRKLRWVGEWEAYYFSTGATRIWQELPDLETTIVQNNLPVLIINGSVSDTFLPESAHHVAQLVPSATTQTLDGHGHLFPQSAPAHTASLIQKWLVT